MTTKCPRCGGYADNGNDREYPPNVYLCSKCESPMTERDEALKWLNKFENGECCSSQFMAMTQHTIRAALQSPVPEDQIKEMARITAELIMHGIECGKAYVPEGYVLVPREPTGEMLDAGEKNNEEEWLKTTAYQVYKAMIQAAQKGNDNE